MKRALCLLLLAAAPLLVRGQGTFPLQSGNAWRYWWMINVMNGGYETTQILGDTVMPDGQSYLRYMQSYLPVSSVRLSGDTVFARDYADTSEFVLFHPRWHVGDTLFWSVRTYGIPTHTVVTSIETTDATFPEMAGSHRRWTIRRYVEGDAPIPVNAWVLEEGVGLIYYEDSGLTGASATLVGVRINGHSYGQMTRADGPTHLPENSLVISAYPNPFNSETLLTVTSPHAGQLSVDLYDLRGRRLGELLSQRVASGVSKHLVRFSAYASGVYILRAMIDGSSTSLRVLHVR